MAFDGSSKALIEKLAFELAKQGKPEREALFIATDPSRRAEKEALLKAAEKRAKEAA